VGPTGHSGVNNSSFPLNLSFTQSNGNGFETTSTVFVRAGVFAYRGSLVDSTISQVIFIVYTTNPLVPYQARLQDTTNNQTIALGAISNVGTRPSPEIQVITTITNLPATPAVFEIQIRRTIPGGAAGILTVQVYG
jgi:hypothetical protein